MKILSSLTVTLFLVLSSIGQIRLNEFFTDQEIAQAETAKSADYLTDEEKQVFTVTNLARLFPQKFADDYLPALVESAQPFEKSGNYRSLIRDLKKMEPVHVLKPQKLLYEIAQKHAIDMGEAGKIGHDGANGKSFSKRMQPIMDEYYGYGENCQYGYDKASWIVVDLLIDEGIPSLDHRKNLLANDFYFMGASIEPHEKYRFNCVQVFAAQKEK
ncbi:CAP domain-containing protein [Salibacter halophilus]|uniref:CAP domain-containing protein n=1 Tax=Salibacter halophilus TaxID=1803916 RepID=A0A6N6M1U6_9FLAO|nr:CAP domain-containing protein [Salibacter halophilus]KAB1062128.1 CAP domain-containing protein [Salibacter halophilus]